MRIDSKYSEIASYITKDGSTVRELMHPNVHGNRQQSLAEATVPPGATTLLHRHMHTEELYHITHGRGLMTLGGECFEVGVGQTVCITPGTPHRIENVGDEPLTILCACSPAYSHGDTELLEPR